MKELTSCELNLVSGGNGPSIDPENAQILKDIAIDTALGAATTPLAPWVGGGLGAASSVIHGAINHGPVNVPVDAMIGPSWNGSGMSSQCYYDKDFVMGNPMACPGM